MDPVSDQLSRPLRDLRISVTDRCNFRCVYCMPREVFGPGYAFVPRKDLLTLEEIARIAQAFATLGMRKVRITGGEPLIRRWPRRARRGGIPQSASRAEVRVQAQE